VTHKPLIPGPPDGLYITSLDQIVSDEDPQVNIRPAARRDIEREEREKSAPTRRPPLSKDDRGK
jgi:hypothetical protein